jgi:GDP-L-fucose synthase
MKTAAKIYVAGHRGLAGSAIVRRLQAAGYRNLVTRPHAELDLIDAHAVREFFQRERPEAVFLAAARVGGIWANNTRPAEFIFENLAIQTNVIDEARRAGVERLLFLGSACIYPRDSPQPMQEEVLLTGPLEPTNRPYALAKIAGVEMCWSYNRQYGTRYVCAMPTNLYGPGDNYDPESSHVLAALLRRFHEAKESGAATITLWGSGAPKREFLYSDDMADACIHLLKIPFNEIQSLAPDRPPLINIGSGEEHTIHELAEIVRGVVGGSAKIAYDRSRPDGVPRKLLDSGRMRTLGWRPAVTLKEGLQRAYASFLDAKATA